MTAVCCKHPLHSEIKVLLSLKIYFDITINKRLIKLHRKRANNRIEELFITIKNYLGRLAKKNHAVSHQSRNCGGIALDQCRWQRPADKIFAQ